MPRGARVVTVGAAALAGTSGVVLAAVLGAGDTADAVAVGVAVLAYLAVAVVLCLVRPGERVAWLLLAGGTAWGVGEGLLALGIHGLRSEGAVPEPALMAVLGTAIRGLGWLLLVVLLPLVFPDGRRPWPGRRWPEVVAAVGIAGFTAATLLSPRPLERRLEAVDSPTGVPDGLGWVTDLLALGSLAVLVVALVAALAGLRRRWRVGAPLQRQQVQLFAVAFALPVLFLPVVATTLAEPWMFALVVIPVPVATCVALLQKGLYDIQPIAGRGLALLALSAAVAGLYAVTVAGVGALLGARGAPWVGWIGAGVVAVSFVPLRDALQRAANRLVHGRWSDPRQVLGETARRLADTTDPSGLLQSLTAEVAEGLTLSAVWITDASGAVVARHGASGEATGGLVLAAYGRPVGRLSWRGGRLREDDRRLLEDLAGQLGAVLHAAGLVASLQRARERLVVAREEERRRLRRDLHDGLGPELASLTLAVDTVRNQVGLPGFDLDGELVRLRAGIQATVASVRRLVEGLRPPALDEVGLVGALEQLAGSLSERVAVTVDAPPLPPMPAATEVAAYRVVQEALTNVVRHSGAGCARVDLGLADGHLVVEVRDEGRGGAHPRPGGVGLGSMVERAAELAGSCRVVSRPGEGTRVHLALPLAVREATRAEVVDA